MTHLLRGHRTREGAAAPADATPAKNSEPGAGGGGPEPREEEHGADESGPQAGDVRAGGSLTDGAVPDGPVADGAVADGSETGAAEAGGDGPAGEPGGRRRLGGRRLRATALAVLAAVLVLAGCGFFYRAHELRSDPAAENRALTDTEATTRVAGDIADDLARVFSYTPDGLDATERSARTVLTGRAARQYTQLIDRIRADVTKQRVTLSTQVARTGVIRLDGDDARLLVFLDQVSRRGKAAGASAAAQLTITAHRENDQWRIVDITTR